jgi:hypothetical protein
MHEQADSRQVTFPVVVPVARSAKRPTTARTRATARAVKAIQGLVDRFTPKDIDYFAARIEEALDAPVQQSPQAALARDLAGGHVYTREEQAALEAEMLVRSFRLRESLLEGALTAPQVAEILGTSRQTPHDRVKSGTLLAVLDNGVLRFPAWQFDPEGPDRIVPGLPRVTRALPSDMSSLAKVNWFVRSSPYLEGRTPLAALKDGDADRVVDLARSLSPG